MKPIIAFTGPAGCGKSTAALHLVVSHGFTRMRFAEPLKAMLRTLGLSHDEVDGPAKEMPCHLLCGKTPRWAMQTLGTEWGRDLIGSDLWVRAWRNAQASIKGGVVVDDCRFPNEVEAIQAERGLIVRLEGRGASIATASHQSEHQQLGHHITINNSGSRRQLYAELDALVRDFSWVSA